MIISKARKAMSFVFMLKAMVGFSVVALTIFGVAVPHFGVEPTVTGQGTAALFGALVGAVVAARV